MNHLQDAWLYAAYNNADIRATRRFYETITMERIPVTNLYNPDQMYDDYIDANSNVGRRLMANAARNDANLQRALADFTPVTLYLPNELAERVRGKVATQLESDDVETIVNLVSDELPELFEVYAGLEYEYPSNSKSGSVNKYRVEQLGAAHAIVRRMTSNRAGAKRTRFATSIEKIRHDLENGIAVISHQEEEPSTPVKP